ncbi:CoA-binding protein [Paenibacillus spiritus]|uniref:CoA-binding protein n=1 Tax=Paenibacillus spiritus TaxID=2496557 RepID=A0A5J5G8I3_9BACL|nr:CoA-binding protein [Paenibacillus spiritus]KAA9004017.1 CoA-binding protein [Paenibacillus spiritus]
MPFVNPDQYTIRDILSASRTIAVVGLSDKTDRTSYMVAGAMQAAGYRIIPVNPAADDGSILGEKVYAKLEDIPEQVDIVNVFRKSEYCPEIARQTVAIGAKVLWLQQGVHSLEAAFIAESNGLTVIMDRCIKVEEALTRAHRNS